MKSILLLVQRSWIKLINWNPYIEAISSSMTSDIVFLNFTSYASIWSLYFTRIMFLALSFYIHFLCTIKIDYYQYHWSLPQAWLKRCLKRLGIGDLWWTIMTWLIVDFFCSFSHAPIFHCYVLFGHCCCFSRPIGFIINLELSIIICGLISKICS